MGRVSGSGTSPSTPLPSQVLIAEDGVVVARCVASRLGEEARGAVPAWVAQV